MALTVTDPIGFAIPIGDRWLNLRHVDFDASYPTGGEAISDAELGYSQPPDVVIVQPKAGFVFEYDGANDKILARFADYDAVADGALVDVTNATDLSAVTDVVVISIGKHAI